MKWPWTVERKPATPAEEKLQKIQNILFPPLEKHVDPSDEMSYYVDYTSDMNLHGAIIDLEEGHNDKVVHKTLHDIHDRLLEVRKILSVLSEFDPEAKYVIVDTKNPDDTELERLVPRD